MLFCTQQNASDSARPLSYKNTLIRTTWHPPEQDFIWAQYASLHPEVFSSIFKGWFIQQIFEHYLPGMVLLENSSKKEDTKSYPHIFGVGGKTQLSKIFSMSSDKCCGELYSRGRKHIVYNRLAITLFINWLVRSQGMSHASSSGKNNIDKRKKEAPRWNYSQHFEKLPKFLNNFRFSFHLTLLELLLICWLKFGISRKSYLAIYHERHQRLFSKAKKKYALGSRVYSDK